MEDKDRGRFLDPICQGQFFRELCVVSAADRELHIQERLLGSIIFYSPGIAAGRLADLTRFWAGRDYGDGVVCWEWIRGRRNVYDRLLVSERPSIARPFCLNRGISSWQSAGLLVRMGPRGRGRVGAGACAAHMAGGIAEGVGRWA